MKHYTVSAFAMLLISVLICFGVLQSFGRTSRSKAALAAEQTSAAQAQKELLAIQVSANNAQKHSAGADQFLENWTTELTAESNIERVFGQLDNLAVNNLLSPSGKNFTLNTNYFFNGRHTEVQNVNLTVAGDYARTLSWLGAVENTFPLARVEQISYTSAGNSLALAVRFVFPRKFNTE